MQTIKSVIKAYDIKVGDIISQDKEPVTVTKVEKLSIDTLVFIKQNNGHEAEIIYSNDMNVIKLDSKE